MTSEISTSQAAKTRRLWLIGFAAVLFIALVAAVPFLILVLQVSRISGAFTARAAEVDPLIEAVYLDYYAQGKWPLSIEALNQPKLQAIPNDWQYVATDEAGIEPPLLLLRGGPLHMKLVYNFRQNGSLDSPGGWEATSEGSTWPGKFTERIPPKPK